MNQRQVNPPDQTLGRRFTETAATRKVHYPELAEAGLFELPLLPNDQKIT